MGKRVDTPVLFGGTCQQCIDSTNLRHGVEPIRTMRGRERDVREEIGEDVEYSKKHDCEMPHDDGREVSGRRKGKRWRGGGVGGEVDKD